MVALSLECSHGSAYKAYKAHSFEIAVDSYAIVILCKLKKRLLMRRQVKEAIYERGN